MLKFGIKRMCRPYIALCSIKLRIISLQASNTIVTFNFFSRFSLGVLVIGSIANNNNNNNSNNNK